MRVIWSTAVPQAMIYVDAREGLSGDMLLAGLVGLLDGRGRESAAADIGRAARIAGVEFRLTEVKEDNETGLGVSYIAREGHSQTRSRAESMEILARMHGDARPLGSGSLDARILEALFKAESEAHGLPIDQVHIHEVGRGAALTNMYGIARAHASLEEAGAGDFVCSTITTGKGIVVIAHGAFRVPAPACAILLRGLMHDVGADPGERATPTGIAAIKVLAQSQSDIVPTTFIKRSVGFGTRRSGGRLGRTVLYWT